MTQATINFDQRKELDRVSSRIGNAIVAFCRHRLASNPEFSMSELLEYTTSAVHGVAPASPDRILRDLRAKGVIKVDCISRSQSLYRVDGITEFGS